MRMRGKIIIARIVLIFAIKQAHEWQNWRMNDVAMLLSK